MNHIKDFINRNTPIFLIGGLTLLIFVVIIIISQTRPAVSPTQLVELESEELIASHTYIKGNKTAPITIVEFSDFGCPACRAYQPILNVILQEYADYFRLAYRHFPLPQHKNAEKAAAAAQAAGEQGKFWEFSDLLFENQNDFTEQKFIEYADLLDMNVEMFKTHLDNSVFDNIVAEDKAFGTKIGINSTPTFFINGKQVDAVNPANFKNILIEEVQKLTSENPVTDSQNSDTLETTSSDDTGEIIVVDPQLTDIYKVIDETRDPRVIEIYEDRIEPRNTTALAGQWIRWENKTDKEITIKQLADFFPEFNQGKTIQPQGVLEFRLRLRTIGNWTYKVSEDIPRGSIRILELPDDIKAKIPDYAN